MFRNSALQAQLGKAAQGDLPAGALQRQQLLALFGGFKQVQRRMQRAVGRAANQPFVANNAGVGKIDNRLKHRVQIRSSQNCRQIRAPRRRGRTGRRRV